MGGKTDDKKDFKGSDANTGERSNFSIKEESMNEVEDNKLNKDFDELITNKILENQNVAAQKHQKDNNRTPKGYAVNVDNETSNEVTTKMKANTVLGDSAKDVLTMIVMMMNLVILAQGYH